MFGPVHQVKAFEYVEPGRMTLPVAEKLLELKDRVVGDCSRHVDAYVRQRLCNRDDV